MQSYPAKIVRADETDADAIITILSTGFQNDPVSRWLFPEDDARERLQLAPAVEAQMLITGSTEGLGLMAAERLAGDGHAVTLHARNDRCASLAGVAFPAP
jgi:hypothetical protein